MDHFSLFIQSLGSTLLFSIGQSLLLFGCLSVILTVIGKGHAKIKYAASLLSFVGSFIWFVSTWIHQWHNLQANAVLRLQDSYTPIGITSHTIINTEHSNIATIFSKISNILEPYFSIIVIVYCIGLCLMLIRFCISIWQMQTIRTKGLMRVQPQYTALVNKLRSQLNISQSIRLFISERIDVPLVMGSIKPIILLPIATINHLSTEQLETILMHELAHIKRYDYILNVFQMVIETIMFFNPFIWLISSIIRREREHCCDDVVVNNTKQPISYAKALAVLESNRSQSTMALAATGNKDKLFNRIKRIMEMKKNSINYSYLIITVLIVMILVLSLSQFTTVSAQTSKGKNPRTDTSSTITKKIKVIIIDNNGHQKSYTSVDDIPANEKKEMDEVLNDKHTKQKKKIKEVIIVNDDDKNKNTTDEVQNAMKNVDWDEVQQEIKNAFSDTGAFATAMANIKTAIPNIDLTSAMNEAQKCLERAQKSMSDPKLKKQLQTELDNAKKEIEKAKVELEKAGKGTEINIRKEKKDRMGVTLQDIDDFDEMVRKMATDGLINKDNYEIEKKHGKLYIDGIKQSDEVYKKYEEYFSKNDIIIKNKNVNITK